MPSLKLMLTTDIMDMLDMGMPLIPTATDTEPTGHTDPLSSSKTKVSKSPPITSRKLSKPLVFQSNHSGQVFAQALGSCDVGELITNIGSGMGSGGAAAAAPAAAGGAAEEKAEEKKEESEAESDSDMGFDLFG